MESVGVWAANMSLLSNRAVISADVNPIGCISGKVNIIRAATYELARQAMQVRARVWLGCLEEMKETCVQG